MNPLPALKDAAYDRELSGMEIRVYLVLVYELDLQVFREVKQAYIAGRLAVDQGTISRALARLKESGYLDRLADPRGVTKYRLVYCRVAQPAGPDRPVESAA